MHDMAAADVTKFGNGNIRGEQPFPGFKWYVHMHKANVEVDP